MTDRPRLARALRLVATLAVVWGSSFDGRLALAQARAVPTYGADDNGPSVLLANGDGANAYSGVVRVQSRATCSGVFLATATEDDARGDEASAWVATNAHCVDFPGANVVLRDLPGRGTVTFDYFADTQARQRRVPIRRIAYATMKGHDIALVELDARMGELRAAGFAPWRPALTLPRADEPVVIVGAPLQRDPQVAFLRLAACRLEGRAPVVLEYIWHWYDFERTTCADIQPGSSGSPVISRRTGLVVGLVNTTNATAPWYTACQIDSPCEPTGVVATQPPATSYTTPLVGIDRCFVAGDLDVGAPGCPLDPGGGVALTPSVLGSTNPLITSTPVILPRRTWGVRMAGTSYYRYKVVRLPGGDCRDLRGYGDIRSTAQSPLIDDPLPTRDGFYMLCGIGGESRQWGTGWQSLDVPAVSRVYIDTIPSTVPAPIRIESSAGGYFVLFQTAGNEVAQYTVKYGPAGETTCADDTGYRYQFFEFMNVPRSDRAQVFCAMPYDAAGNRGVPFEAILP